MPKKNTDDPRQESITEDPEEDRITDGPKSILYLIKLKRILSLDLWRFRTLIDVCAAKKLF